MTFRTLFLLLATLVSTSGFAADDSDKKLVWPMVAKDGLEYRYETKTTSREEKDGKKKEASTDSITVVKHRAHSSGGLLQVWSSSDSKSEYDGFDDEELELKKELASAFENIELEVILDKDGYFSKIHNSTEIAEQMGAMLRKGFDDGSRKGQKNALTVEQMKKLEAIRNNLVTMMTNPIAIENLVGKTPQFFNFFSGGGLDPAEAYEIDEEGPNPFGGKPFPLKVHMELNLFDDDPGFVQATYISSLDKEKGVPILIEAVEKLLNEPFSAADRKLFEENVEVTNRADMRIRLSDGAIQFFKQTETKKVAGKTNENRIEMTLLEAP